MSASHAADILREHKSDLYTQHLWSPYPKSKDVIPVLSKVTEMPSLSWEDGDLISTWVLSTALTLNLFILPLTAEPAVTCLP